MSGGAKAVPVAVAACAGTAAIPSASASPANAAPAFRFQFMRCSFGEGRSVGASLRDLRSLKEAPTDQLRN
ncbi:hypothetical protein GCM10023192_70460 [Amycolatopsis samaneae]